MMSEKADVAESLFLQGYNCSQSVMGAFAEDLGLDKEFALKLSSSFGGGMGKLREVCGAVSAMFMIAGIKYGYSDPNDQNVKEHHYRLIQNLAEKFKEKNGSIICRELLSLDVKYELPIPSERTALYYESRPCLQIVRNAAEQIEKEMESYIL
jgi:C_GCAxxG_C_C family probable redox protein